MDQFVKPETSPAASRRAARLAKGYSLEDLAIATGLTVEEIAAAEEGDASSPEHHVQRIEHALG
jgi:transcriptional regulator with XRE-family HTH domain